MPQASHASQNGIQPQKPKPRKGNSRLPVEEMPLVGKCIQWPPVMASVNAHFEELAEQQLPVPVPVPVSATLPWISVSVVWHRQDPSRSPNGRSLKRGRRNGPQNLKSCQKPYKRLLESVCGVTKGAGRGLDWGLHSTHWQTLQESECKYQRTRHWHMRIAFIKQQIQVRNDYDDYLWQIVCTDSLARLLYSARSASSANPASSFIHGSHSSRVDKRAAGKSEMGEWKLFRKRIHDRFRWQAKGQGADCSRTIG